MSDTDGSSSHGSCSSIDNDSDSDYGVVDVQVNAYDDEPPARQRQDEGRLVEADEDGLSPSQLEMRSNGEITLNNWCKCKCCHIKFLVGMLEYRCCREIAPATILMPGEESCVIQHVDFAAMINTTVLEQVGPLFKDKNGRPYRRRGDQTWNEFHRAVAYRWLIKWMCGLLGWDNSRPLPACIYHTIRERFPTKAQKGYKPSHVRA